MLNISDNQRVRVFKVEDKGNYSSVTFSTWRKDKRDGEYKYSNWGFVRFVGAAHKKASELEEGSKIVLKGAGISREEYQDSDGNRAWPKQPQVIVFNFEFLDSETSERETEKEETKDTVAYDEDELPF